MSWLTYSTSIHGACFRRSRPIVYMGCGAPAAVSVVYELRVATLSSLLCP